MAKDRIIYDPATGRMIGVVEDVGIASTVRRLRRTGRLGRARIVASVASLVPALAAILTSDPGRDHGLSILVGVVFSVVMFIVLMISTIIN